MLVAYIINQSSGLIHTRITASDKNTLTHFLFMNLDPEDTYYFSDDLPRGAERLKNLCEINLTPISQSMFKADFNNDIGETWSELQTLDF